MARLDLNRARAARLEQRSARGEQHSFVFGDPPQEFFLPAEMPAEFAYLSEEEGLRSAFVLLLGREGFEAFRRLGPTLPDLQELLAQLNELYGMEPGESPPSDEGSPSTGTRSSATSSGSTVSTFPPWSGVSSLSAPDGSARSSEGFPATAPMSAG